MFIVIIPYCDPVVRQVNYRFNAGHKWAKYGYACSVTSDQEK